MRSSISLHTNNISFSCFRRGWFPHRPVGKTTIFVLNCGEFRALRKCRLASIVPYGVLKFAHWCGNPPWFSDFLYQNLSQLSIVATECLHAFLYYIAFSAILQEEKGTLLYITTTHSLRSSFSPFHSIAALNEKWSSPSWFTAPIPSFVQRWHAKSMIHATVSFVISTGHPARWISPVLTLYRACWIIIISPNSTM